jgi:hypothetical protein
VGEALGRLFQQSGRSALSGCNPDRASVREGSVWGSDWPHPGVVAVADKPDDAQLFDLLAVWVPDEAMRNRILVQNPEALYGFPKA